MDELAERRKIRDPRLRKQALWEKGFSESLIDMLLWIPEPDQTDWFDRMQQMPAAVVGRMNSIHARMERERG